MIKFNEVLRIRIIARSHYNASNNLTIRGIIVQFCSSRPREIARQNRQVGARLLSGFVGRRSMLRGARVYIGIRASEAAPSADMQGTRVLVAVVMPMTATRWFS